MPRAADPADLLEAALRVGRGLGLAASHADDTAPLNNPAEALLTAADKTRELLRKELASKKWRAPSVPTKSFRKSCTIGT